MIRFLLTFIAFTFVSCGASTDVSLLGSLSEKNQTSDGDESNSNSESNANRQQDNEDSTERVLETEEQLKSIVEANKSQVRKPNSSIHELIEIRDQHSEQMNEKIKSAE